MRHFVVPRSRSVEMNDPWKCSDSRLGSSSERLVSDCASLLIDDSWIDVTAVRSAPPDAERRYDELIVGNESSVIAIDAHCQHHHTNINHQHAYERSAASLRHSQTVCAVDDPQFNETVVNVSESRCTDASHASMSILRCNSVCRLHAYVW